MQYHRKSYPESNLRQVQVFATYHYLIEVLLQKLFDYKATSYDFNDPTRNTPADASRHFEDNLAQNLDVV